MQTLRPPSASSINTAQLIDVYLGHEIYLSRVVVQNQNKGRWLHWCHPDDVGRKNAPRCGLFVARHQRLEEVLATVHQVIEEMVKLEALDQNECQPLGQSRFREERHFSYNWLTA